MPWTVGFQILLLNCGKKLEWLEVKNIHSLQMLQDKDFLENTVSFKANFQINFFFAAAIVLSHSIITGTKIIL